MMFQHIYLGFGGMPHGHVLRFLHLFLLVQPFDVFLFLWISHANYNLLVSLESSGNLRTLDIRSCGNKLRETHFALSSGENACFTKRDVIK